jgi:hypothetical protein
VDELEEWSDPGMPGSAHLIFHALNQATARRA